ncbi:MAG: hypothetical protein H0U59_04155 [Gemmatimonadaceae bacterium]|nr:hypothetical protein [Gemmatimonadaceae bacterium]
MTDLTYYQKRRLEEIALRDTIAATHGTEAMFISAQIMKVSWRREEQREMFRSWLSRIRACGTPYHEVYTAGTDKYTYQYNTRLLCRNCFMLLSDHPPDLKCLFGASSYG